MFFVTNLNSAHRSPFNIYCKAGPMVINSFSFCLTGKLFIFLSILKDSFAGYCVLGHNPTTFQPASFLLRNLLIVLEGLPYA